METMRIGSGRLGDGGGGTPYVPPSHGQWCRHFPFASRWPYVTFEGEMKDK